MQNAERASLRFVESAKDAFAFLTTDYGFFIVTTDVTFVRYESTHVFVNVYHGRSSYELGVEVGSLDEHFEPAFQLIELVLLHGEAALQRFRVYQTNNADLVRRGLMLLAESLRENGKDALRGDPLIYDTLRKERKRAEQRFALDLHVRQTRPRAEAAWKARDFATAAYFYGQIEEDLSPAEIKKLHYARKKLAERERLD